MLQTKLFDYKTHFFFKSRIGTIGINLVRTRYFTSICQKIVMKIFMLLIFRVKKIIIIIFSNFRTMKLLARQVAP